LDLEGTGSSVTHLFDDVFELTFAICETTSGEWIMS